MKAVKRDGKRALLARGKTAALALAGATLAFATPSAVLALAGGLDGLPVSVAARGGIGSITPSSVDPRLVGALRIGSGASAQMFKFTPAGNPTRPDRAVTVAVRVDGSATARAVSVRQAIAGTAAAGTTMRIAPTAFNLGMSRGYRGFTQPITPAVEVRRIDMPDLASFKPGSNADAGKPSRFTPRIAFDEKARAGSAPRTLESAGEQIVDVGGSYRLTRNLNVTAGVRYSQDRDRIAPLTDGRQDSQAVYVGTQFRF